MSIVTDDYGLVKDNEHLVVFVPGSKKALPFRVLARHNRGGEILNYGSIPITSGEAWGSYDGGTTTAPADNVIPNRAYTMTNSSKLFTPPSDMSNTYSSTDMFYIPADDFRNRIFHIYMDLTPHFIRCGIQIPRGQNQLRYQNNRVILGVDKTSGWQWGGLELVQFPEINMGYMFGNDTNVDWYNSVVFRYGEYIIGIPGDAETIFDLLNKNRPAHWLELPIASYDSTIRAGFNKTYADGRDFDGFKLYSKEDKAYALNEYAAEISKLSPEVVIGRPSNTNTSRQRMVR